ncbi:hypothetical protein OAG20_03360, partial [Verrucomicrobiales bacterium]|nr:hypothetical protein [Verrucomicrobiales bacterium]
MFAALEQPRCEGAILQAMELCEGSTAQSTAFEFVEDGFAPGLWDADTLEGVDFKDSVIKGYRRCHSRRSMTSPLFSARGVPGTAYVEIMGHG